jgi:hypothetical protein
MDPNATNAQQALVENKDLFYLTSSSAIALDFPSSCFILFLVIRGTVTYKASGLTLWLLIALFAGILCFGVANVFLLIGSHKLIQANE